MANMTQLGLLERLDGFLLVDKPEGIAFSSVVKAVKRKFNLVKVGHGGSLDALASGLLVLLINDANKFVDRVMGADRAYTGTMRLGIRTNTHDIKGETLPAPAASGPGDAAAALKAFRGDVFQTEPRFSSVRREGSAAYEIADTGEHTPFLAHVFRFEIPEPAAMKVGADVAFALKASKAVLPRTLVNDFGEALGCGAALSSLRRTAVGTFEVKDSIPFSRLLELEMRDFAAWIRPISSLLR